jgi:two-component sensor histidine kinase
MRGVEAQLIHEMQNTAMVLREASAQLHESRGTLPPEVVDHLTEMVARRSAMLVRLLSDLSTSNLAERGDLDMSLQRVSLSDLCHELLPARQPAGRAPITLDVADDAVVVADPMRLTQVLDNLVTNAQRYGGPNVHVSARRDGATIRLSVSDDGPGVAPDLVATLFDAYVHGASSHSLGGSGLGLLIVRQLCDAMNGTIEYDGSQGARFTATLPALPTASAQLGADTAGSTSHSVAFWLAEDDLTEALVAYVAHGLTKGEAVLVSVTPTHQRLLEAALSANGVDHAAAKAAGQYVVVDAEALHNDLPRFRHIDRDRFESLIGRQVEQLRRRWRSLRVFGEIVDLYWRNGDDHLALELEACWTDLRARAPFPLLCSYELAPGQRADAICDCHDLVVSA